MAHRNMLYNINQECILFFKRSLVAEQGFTFAIQFIDDDISVFNEGKFESVFIEVEL